MPIPKKLEDMEGSGWKKELTIKHIEIKSGVPYCQEWDFFADRLPCRIRDGLTGPQCGIDHVWVGVFHGKLFQCCHRHRTSQGPLTFDVGVKAEEYIVPASEALKICEDFDQDPPQELVDIVGTERARAGKRYRRPK